MHALLAHATHLALMPVHLAWLPMWRPLLVALAVAMAARAAGGRAPLSAALATLSGWAAQDFGDLAAWPPPAAGRLPGLALIVAIEAVVRQRAKGKPGPWLLPLAAASGAWWLRGAPLSGQGVINCMPVFLGLLGAFALARRLARGDAGWGSFAAALALAGGVWLTGASLHWVRAALVPAAAAAALLGLADGGPAMVMPIVMVAAAILVASVRGRLTPVDAACVLPLLVWALAPRLAPRLARSTPAVAGLVAAALCMGLAWVVGQALG